MSKYASGTSVPIEKSKAEIEATVRRYGADGFSSGWTEEKAVVHFRCKDRIIRFTMVLPARNEERFTHFRRSPGSFLTARSETSAREQWEQACRQKWRALALLVKAKLEAVDAGIATFEEAFFADIVMPETNRTVYETAREQLALAYAGNANVPLLPGGAQ